MAGQDVYQCQASRNVSPGEQRILNGLGNENAAGTVLGELHTIRHTLRTVKVGSGAEATATTAATVHDLTKLLTAADAREIALANMLNKLKTEVEFYKLKADEWERTYRQHMEGHDDRYSRS